ncbi:hypothetical protein GGR51DRAFT_96341 [Nemania sp. FL0031]|nr:hypothetical protein GGR51DRAFT_96341 [Nemania sp. FL0031]
MASQPILTPDVSSESANSEPAEACYTAGSECQAVIRHDSEDEGYLEPGEVVPTPGIKQEEDPPNPFLKKPFISNGHDNPLVSPFAHVPVTPNSLPFGWPQSHGSSLGETPQSATAVQRRNHARVSDIVTRLQNFDGSVTELLAIASVQQQLDAAFDDLDHARNSLKDVFRQFEIHGQMTKRQCQKANGTVRDLSKAAQCIAQLTKRLADLQRRKPAGH